MSANNKPRGVFYNFAADPRRVRELVMNITHQGALYRTLLDLAGTTAAEPHRAARRADDWLHLVNRYTEAYEERNPDWAFSAHDRLLAATELASYYATHIAENDAAKAVVTKRER